MPMETFGTRMVFLRKNSEDPQTQGPLTQSRLADLLNDYDHTLLFSKTQISNWEKGRRSIPLHQRSLLIGLIYVFTTCGGLSEKEAADAFLQSGGYAPLTDDEIKQLPDKALFENRQKDQNGTEQQSLLTIAGILQTLEKQSSENGKLRQTLSQIEGQRLAAIANISTTQRGIMGAIPYSPTPIDEVFQLIYEKVPQMEGIRLKEINLRLHELRYLGLIERERHPEHRWMYWRETPKSFFT